MSIKFAVDMHCHILPGIDDGSQSMESTLKMIKIAADEGITHMIATPHYKNDRHSASPGTILKLVSEVQNLADENKLGLTILPGNEIMFFSDMEEAYDAGKLTTMNQSEYLMIEFYPDDEYSRIKRGVEMTQSLGLHPVLAHVERFAELRKDIGRIAELKNRGAFIQVNASSMVGEQGFGTKQFVKKLLKDELIDFVGTDAHHYEKRAPHMEKCINYLERKVSEEYAKAILYKNAFECFNITENK